MSGPEWVLQRWRATPQPNDYDHGEEEQLLAACRDAELDSFQLRLVIASEVLGRCRVEVLAGLRALFGECKQEWDD